MNKKEDNLEGDSIIPFLVKHGAKIRHYDNELAIQFGESQKWYIKELKNMHRKPNKKSKNT